MLPPDSANLFGVTSAGQEKLFLHAPTGMLEGNIRFLEVSQGEFEKLRRPRRLGAFRLHL